MSSQPQQVSQVPAAAIDPGSNDRKHFDPVALAELADSIRQHGLAQPITVRPMPEGRYQIVAGERRFRAISGILHWETVPCLVREMTDEEAAAIMLAENTSRADLNPIEEAQAYRARIEQFGWTVQRVAEVAGVGEQRVKDRTALLSLIPDAQHMVAHGHFPLGHALLLVDLDTNRQRIALRVYNEAQHMPLWKFKGIVNELLTAQNQQSLFDMEALLVMQVQEEGPAVTKGRKARTGAPTRKDLPPVRWKMTDGIAHVMDRYIHDLAQAGHADEAAAMGNLYNTLVAHNWTAIPTGALLPQVSEVEEQAGQAHEMQIA